MPGAPIQFNSDVQLTDESGEATTDMVHTTLYSVASGIDGISFTPLFNDGATFASQSPITIAASRLIAPSTPPCRLVIGGVAHLYFSTLNQTDTSLTIPLTYPLMNSMFSVTGEAIPPEVFAPAESGFVIPESYFTQSEGLAGVWKFLGLSVALSSSPDYCTSGAVAGQCTTISQAVISSPFDYTSAIVRKLIKQSIAAAKSGRWKTTAGRFSLPFQKRAAQALAIMKPTTASSNRQYFVCESALVTSACSNLTMPKKEYLQAFSRIFTGKWPAGLAHIQAQQKREYKKFQAELKKAPNAYVSCPKGGPSG